MNWEAIGAIGELIGAVGVILALGYLAFQIRQNTLQLAQNERSSIAAAVYASATALRENRKSVYENPEVTELWLKGMNNPVELADADRYRFRLLMHNVLDATSAVYSQTVVTGFSPETWATQGATAVERVVTTAGGRWFWEQFKGNYTNEFRAEVDRVLESNSSIS